MTTKQPTIAITGANGFLGSTLTKYFSAKGWNVICLVRNPASCETQSAYKNVRYENYDISKRLELNILRNVDYLVHAAYVKYDTKHPDAMQINLKGTKQLLKASRDNKLRRTIFISTMSAHDEAISVYGKQKLALEKLFNGERDTVIKCGLIIGNGGIVKQMSDFMKSKHAVPLIGGGKQPLQIVAIDDVVKVIDSIIKLDAKGSYVVATPTIYSYKDFYKALAKHLKIKILYVPIPYSALQAAFRAASLLRLPLGVGEDNLKGLKMLRAMDSSNDLNSLGVDLKNLDQALAVLDT